MTTVQTDTDVLAIDVEAEVARISASLRDYLTRARRKGAIVALSGTVAKLTRDYFDQRRQGIEPRFHGRDYPELKGVDPTIWTRE